MTDEERSHITILPPRDPSFGGSSRMTTDFLNSLVVIDRDKWQNRKEFFFTTLAFCLSLANLWRFPKEALLHGNGSFVWLYIIFTVGLGSSLFFFEVALGQYSSKGFSKVFAMCPLFEGISYSMSFYCAIVSMFYNMLNVYSFIYFLSSFVREFPFATCPVQRNNCIEGNVSELYAPEFVYFRDNIIQYVVKNPYTVMTGINWRNVGILLFFFVFIAIAIVRGVRTTKWLPIVICIIPYVILVTIICLSILISGSKNGLARMFTPNVKELLDIQTWAFAFEQTIITLGIGMGPLITFGSYSKFHSPAHLDCFILCICALVSSLLCGMVMFSITGILAQESGQSIENVFKISREKRHLDIHVVYSQFITRMPFGIAHFSTAMFYLMYLLVGLYSLTGYTETFIISLYSTGYIKGKYKLHANIFMCVILFVLGSFFASVNGHHALETMDRILIGPAPFVIILCEMIAVIYIYGVFDFCDDIEFMIGLYPNAYYQITWISLPFVIAGVFIYHLAILEIWHYHEYIMIMLNCVFIFAPIIFQGIYNAYEYLRKGDIRQVLYPREVIIYSDDDIHTNTDLTFSSSVEPSATSSRRAMKYTNWRN